ncbi:3,4-dihydroxy 2-butanone 4-phosphate synthase / GTP cyclohydrolase II [Alteribacillus persepolensis]|uniref:3,4-dihydroxy-2-butanone-4-phosphate synthase n=1 Tax=Alteribacillus persepolensis TaxID=568899 RepID=A0A1G8F870_9BACI|nr:3,4-dihydroxy-2-butanone-4-phosphate synthase [Alteribacillus persepolensis]SDH78346.1 3,4-dihydroxy 2-butanone 4-phosphate synthase / GTP cyclohydrolase II [Alteribacillus persepolensis]
MEFHYKRTQSDVMSDHLIIVEDDVHTKTSYLMGNGSAITPDDINFMIKHGKGLVYACISEKTAKILKLPYMDRFGGAKDSLKNSSISIDYKTTTTGISAAERATTIKHLSVEATPDDFKRPGHVFPLVYKQDGLLENTGIAEAAYELTQMITSHLNTNTTPVLCEILNTHGHIASSREVQQLASQHKLTIITVSEIINLYLQKRKWLKIIDTTTIQMNNRTLDIYKVDNLLYPSQFNVYVDSTVKQLHHFSFHKECLWGDVLDIKDKCSCLCHLKEHLVNLVHEKEDCVVYQRHTTDKASIPAHYEIVIKQQMKHLIQQERKLHSLEQSMTV